LEELVCQAEIEIKNADGLHMRPAMQFVDVASKFEANVRVSNMENDVDGKSIMQMSMLAATYGTKLKVTTEGQDAKEALEAIIELVENEMFGEEPPKEKKIFAKKKSKEA